jgi:hypothetical protein
MSRAISGEALAMTFSLNHKPVADLSDDSPMLDAGFYEQLGDEEQSAAEASGDD